jgi:PAS domain-containing protein
MKNLTRPERNRYFRLAVESEPNAMVMVNHEARIVLVNSPAEMLFGYERQELLGQPVEILVPESRVTGTPWSRNWEMDGPKVCILMTLIAAIATYCGAQPGPLSRSLINAKTL